MKINFKTIAGKKYEIEIDPSQTISEVKSFLQNNHNITGNISLLYKSKYLDDSQTIESIDFTENTFIAIFKGKTQIKKNSVNSDKDHKSKNEINENQNTFAKTETKTNETQPFNTEPSKHIHSSPIKNLLTTSNARDPPDFKEKVEQLKVLGFNEYDCENALRATVSYDVELAYEYLASGYIPDIPKQVSIEDTLNILKANCDDHDEEEDENIQLLNDLVYLKKLLQEKPENFALYVSQIEACFPDLAKTIRRDPALFLTAQLGLDPSKFDIGSVKTPTSEYERLMNQFNSEEKNAIHRIESNGFDTMTVIQVYIACDKNEELTNSCLISMRS
ncbi:hypothetical protein M9Y10_037852 [Tritrichomonas musculus]|uniref:UV excision repair protein RAD23 n=1 Tax=Tritrichomonas musculus TaxID=1915356 RepID=A0ABR2K6X0_9EUKA